MRPQAHPLSHIAFTTATLALLAVLAFHFPQYLTTPELRHNYNADALRFVLFVALVLAGALAVSNVIFSRDRAYNMGALLVLSTGVALGGHRVPIASFPDHTPYLGMDWLILDLLGTALVFVTIEKCAPLRRQQLFRRDWQTDLAHFGVNHLLVGAILLVVNGLVHGLFGWMVLPAVQSAVQSLPFLAELLLTMLVADLVQYWIHRAYHRVPMLWRLHAVHHSTTTLDWLAGSRIHVMEMVMSRVAVLGPLFVLGFSREVMDAYVITVGFHAVLIHANVRIPWGPLERIFVTPAFHHWHHAADAEAIDRNFALHFAFLDTLFGTAFPSGGSMPRSYGVVSERVPDDFLRQQVFPFVRG